MQGLRSNFALSWAPVKGGFREPLVMFSPLGIGDPGNARVMYQCGPLLGPREGKGQVATSDFVPGPGVLDP